MNAPFVLCMAPYRREVAWVGHVVTFSCQYPRDHDGAHSWQVLKDSDELAARPPDPEQEQGLRAAALGAVLLDIADGEYDPYLENLLAVVHERKRVLRGVRSFDQPVRPQPRRPR